MSSETIPEWATEEAGKIADVWQHPMHHDHQILSQDIARALLAAEQRGFEKAKPLVEQSFRDGLAYGSNTENADPDVAWEHSRVRKAMQEGK